MRAKLLSGSRDRLRLSEFSFQSTEGLTRVVVGMMQSMSAEPKSDGKAVSHLARARVQHFPCADLFLWTRPQPGSESRSVSETGEVRANFAQNGLSPD